jgi:hypothetical protein
MPLHYLKPTTYKGFQIGITKRPHGLGYLWSIKANLWGKVRTYREGLAMVENKKMVKAIAKEQINQMD